MPSMIELLRPQFEKPSVSRLVTAPDLVAPKFRCNEISEGQSYLYFLIAVISRRGKMNLPCWNATCVVML